MYNCVHNEYKYALNFTGKGGRPEARQENIYLNVRKYID